MKLVQTAALASLFVFGSAFADGSAAPTAAATTEMNAAECTTKLAQCADQACKDELVKQGCKAEASSN